MAKKVTGKKVATIASKILKDKRYSQSVKSVEGVLCLKKRKERSNILSVYRRKELP